MTTLLDRDQIWTAIDTQRARVADLLDELTDDQWRHPSLCEGWKVRDVAAHLTLQQLTWGDLLGALVRYRGNVNRGMQQMPRERAAAMSTAQLVAAIRATVGSRRHNVGVTNQETLIDILVHGLDIAVPLGRRLDVDRDAATTAVTRMWTMRFPPPFPATKVLKQFHVIATDADWSAGTGPQIHGPITAILLVSSGRLAALPQLSGPGTADLANRLHTA